MILNTANQIAAQGISRSSAKTQRARILRVLLDAKGSWVPLPVILELRISQFGARIFELRRTGFVIENKTERDDSGAVHSWYRLLGDVPKADLSPSEAPKPPQTTRANSGDWYEREHGARPAGHPWKKAFSKRRLAEADCFVLTPPETQP